MASIAFQAENERLLEKHRVATGAEVRSFEDWKIAGKFVKKGEKQVAVRVKSGVRGYEDAITGETIYEPTFKTAYGFAANQVR